MKYENAAKSRSRGRLVVVGHLEKFGVKYRFQKKRKKKNLIDELLTNSYAANSLLLLLLLFCLDARFDFRFRFSPGAMEPESRSGVRSLAMPHRETTEGLAHPISIH